MATPTSQRTGAVDPATVKKRVSVRAVAAHLRHVADDGAPLCPQGCRLPVEVTFSRYTCAAETGGCGASGDVIDFLRAVTGAAFAAAVTRLDGLARQGDREEIDALKAAVPMPYLVHTVLGHPGHGKIRCLDPAKHSNGDASPSCAVNDTSLHCFVCGLHLDVIGVLMKERSLTFGQALDELRRLAPTAGAAVAASPTPLWQRDGTDYAELYDALFACCAPLENSRGGDYLASRGISPSVAATLGVVYADNAAQGRMYDVLEKFPPHVVALTGVLDHRGLLVPRAHRLWLPARHRPGGLGEPWSVVWWQGRSTNAATPHQFRFRSLDGIATALMWPEALDTPTERPIYICEGGTDGLAAWSAGKPALSHPGNLALKGWWVSQLRDRHVVLAEDGNTAGDRGRNRWEEALKGVAATVEHLRLPAGVDLNEHLFPDAPYFRRRAAG